jgi:hypothetical protein
MIDFVNGLIQAALFFSIVGLIYAIVLVVDVIREERERLMWYRQTKAPVLNDKDDYNEPPKV